ncbi:uncharacterized protein LOC116248970 [Nymphaea colorata]|uniref:uncharacterized protein LOC116248970 n=1 Tax=Nymphaea colorata TaxID=210225 RepID=UPI00129D4934|nr:uncharacterized protein LOC116248970 [Nymphaea colorata]
MVSFSRRSQIFLLCIFLIAPSLQIHARESKFFRRETPYGRPTYKPEVNQEEFSPFPDFNDTTQWPDIKETASNLNGHGLYGQEPQWFPTEQRDQPQVEGKEFAPFNSDFNDTTQLPLFKETSSPPQNQNGTLFGQEHQQFPATGNITTNTTTITTTTELENRPTTVDYSPFKRESTNHYDEEQFESKDLNSGFSGYGMSGTRSTENGRYFDDLKNDYGRNGFPYGRRTVGARYEYPYRGVSPSEEETRYRSYGGSYGNENAYYGSNNYHLKGNQEEEDDFLP